MIPAGVPAIAAILGFVTQNIPQLWDIGKTTVEAVAIHFNGLATGQEKKDLVIKNLSAWYRFVDKQAQFSDEQDDFFLNKMLPDLVQWIYWAVEFDLKKMIANIFNPDTDQQPVLDPSVKQAILDGDLAIKMEKNEWGQN